MKPMSQRVVIRATIGEVKIAEPSFELYVGSKADLCCLKAGKPPPHSSRRRPLGGSAVPLFFKPYLVAGLNFRIPLFGNA